MFKHNWIDLKSIEMIQNGGKRYYETPYGRFPSITSILSTWKDKTPIEEWKKRIGEKEADKIIRQSVNRGNTSHQLWESYLRNEEIPEIKNPSILESFNQLKDIFDERVDNIHGLEEQLYSKTLKLAGTVDCIAEYNGVLSIIDFKTSRSEKRKEWITDYFMQATSYSIMLEEMTGIRTDQIVILMEVMETGKPLIFVEDPNNWVELLIEARETYAKIYNK